MERELLILLIGMLMGAVGGAMLERGRLLLAGVEQRLCAIEAAQAQAQEPKRHTHATAAGLEDGIAIAIDLIREYQSNQEYASARLQQLTGVLRQVRQGPYAYDAERPAGAKPKKDA